MLTTSTTTNVHRAESCSDFETLAQAYATAKEDVVLLKDILQ